MSQPVIVHFEIIGRGSWRAARVFTAGCSAGILIPIAPSPPPSPTPETMALSNDPRPAMVRAFPAASAAGRDFSPQTIFYVGVDDVETALQQAENLGGTRRLGPEKSPSGTLVVGHFTDPEGNLVGIAGPK